MAKYFYFLLALCLIQLCLSAPAAETHEVTASSSASLETTTSASSKSIENLTNEQLLALIKEWGEELKKPNITQTEKDDNMMAIIGASFLMASRAGQLDLGSASSSSEESNENVPFTTATSQKVNS